MELLKDPYNDRVIKDCPLPPSKALKDDLLFPTKGINAYKNFQEDEDRPNSDLLREFLVQQGFLTKAQVIKIILKAKAIMSKFPSQCSRGRAERSVS